MRLPAHAAPAPATPMYRGGSTCSRAPCHRICTTTSMDVCSLYARRHWHTWLSKTLHLVGTDWRNGSSYSWVLRDPSPASWLQIERTHGTVTASQSASDVSTNLGVDIQSAGLRDASQSTASIQFDFTLSASVQGRSHPAQQLSFSITLYVSAMATASSFERSFAPVYLNEQMSLKFVARDVRQRNCSKPHLSSDDTVSPAPSGHSKPYLAHSLL
jgi:hypothetical protein